MMFDSTIAAFAPRTAPVAAAVCFGITIGTGFGSMPENQGQNMITGPGGP